MELKKNIPTRSFEAWAEGSSIIGLVAFRFVLLGIIGIAVVALFF